MVVVEIQISFMILCNAIELHLSVLHGKGSLHEHIMQAHPCFSPLQPRRKNPSVSTVIKWWGSTCLRLCAALQIHAVSAWPDGSRLSRGSLIRDHARMVGSSLG